MANKTDKTQTEKQAEIAAWAYGMGVSAFAKGIKAPCLDKLVMELIAQYQNESIAILLAWNRGWNTSNLSGGIEFTSAA